MGKKHVETLLVAAAMTGLAMGGISVASKAFAGSKDGKLIAKADKHGKKKKCHEKKGCGGKDKKDSDPDHDGDTHPEGGEHAE